jgi:hypothetical protein
LNGSVGASFDPVRNLMFDVDIAASPRSCLREQATITTGGHCSLILDTIILSKRRSV